MLSQINKNDVQEYCLGRRIVEFCPGSMLRIGKKFGWIPAITKREVKNEKIFPPVDHKSGNVKNQIASVIKHLPSYYQFQTLGQYNALLSLFNVSIEKVEGELQGKNAARIDIFPLDKNGVIVGHPFKASLFGKDTGLNSLLAHFLKCKESLTRSKAKDSVK